MKKLQFGLWMGTMLLALSATLGHAQVADVVVQQPKDRQTVCASQEVTGIVSDAAFRVSNEQVWIVINPLQTPGDYWVQDAITVGPDLTWDGFVHFGEAGKYSGFPFQFRAFVGPLTPLTVGKSLSGWPQAKFKSNVVRVTRADC